MMSLLCFCCLILLLCCCQLRAEGQCDQFSELVLTASCKPIVNEYKEFQRNQRNQPVKDFQKMSVLNKRIDECLDSHPCADSNRDKLRAEHELVNYHVPNIMLCLKGFFRKSYQSQYSRDGTCYENFPFLDTNLIRRRNAFIDGHSCFLKHVKDQCFPPSREFFSRENYKSLTKSFTTVPDASKCEAPHFYLEAIACSAIFEEFTNRLHVLNKITNRAKNPFVLEAMSICKDLQRCNSNPCLSNNIGWDTNSLGVNCHRIETEYWN
ncbi:unnamed protein product [Caenorhabditis brenneri]